MRLGSLLVGLGLGAGLMYLYDKESGERRRLDLQEQLNQLRAGGTTSLTRRTRHLRNQAMGKVAELRARTRQENVSDDVLIARIRSKMGLVVSHPRSIEVTAENGRVILSGSIRDEEVDRLLQTVSNIPGVEIVENWLEEYEESEEAHT